MVNTDFLYNTSAKKLLVDIKQNYGNSRKDAIFSHAV